MLAFYPSASRQKHLRHCVVSRTRTMTGRACRKIFAATAILLASAAGAMATDQVKRDEPDARVFALMSGRCSTLRVAGRNFSCRAVAYSQNEEGRGNFAIALDDPSDESHIITFSGDNGRRSENNLFELPIDRMLLNSQQRPKVDGLPVPLAEMSAGICRQLGNFAAGQVSSISCNATDKSGNQYELQFESDGSPITLRRIRRSAPTIWLDPRQ